MPMSMAKFSLLFISILQPPSLTFSFLCTWWQLIIIGVNDMSNRDVSLATFFLTYIAFLPTLRENLPETPKLVFT